MIEKLHAFVIYGKDIGTLPEEYHETEMWTKAGSAFHLCRNIPVNPTKLPDTTVWRYFHQWMGGGFYPSSKCEELKEQYEKDGFKILYHTERIVNEPIPS